LSKPAAKQNELARINLALATKKLKKTPLRVKILLAFASTKRALTQGMLIDLIEKDLETVDRVSVYRNIAHLQNAGLLHAVDVNQYIFCAHNCQQHPHLLFFCQMCHTHEEISDHKKIGVFMEELAKFRFFGKLQPIFIKSVCAKCTKELSAPAKKITKTASTKT
jgi:Fe2+ or Zn2+ uptake regulation protein